MSSPSNEKWLKHPIRLKEEPGLLDLNESPPMTSHEKEHTWSKNEFPSLFTICSHERKGRVDMLEEALATIQLSFKRQETETSKSTLVIENGILTLVQQHQSQDQAEEQKQKCPRRGLRTSYTAHYVDGQFELPNECVNYILIRDKYRQRLSSLIGKNVPNIDTRRSHLSVHNRLEGWRVETRKRPNKTHDKFYHHRSLGRMFRSLVEVEKFIKYEIYPPKPQRLNKNRTKKHG